MYASGLQNEGFGCKVLGEEERKMHINWNGFADYLAEWVLAATPAICYGAVGVTVVIVILEIFLRHIGSTRNNQ